MYQTIANEEASVATMSDRMPVLLTHDTASDGLIGPRFFKKHKVLPHPTRHHKDGQPRSASDLMLQKYNSPTLNAMPRHASQPVGSPGLKHGTRRIHSGPTLPPTPPTHSRTSSSSQSIPPPSPTPVDTPLGNSEPFLADPQRPSTPMKERSPPTPDVTPPQTRPRPKGLRPFVLDRSVSKATSDSRTESFRTAREEPYVSEEDDSRSTVRPSLTSGRTSQMTIRQLSPHGGPNPQARTEPLGLGLALDGGGHKDDVTPRSKDEFLKFDGGWDSSSEVEQQWDDNLARMVTVRKRRKRVRQITPTADTTQDGSVLVDDQLVTPTNATKAVRSLVLKNGSPDGTASLESPEGDNLRMRAANWATPANSEQRRLSGMSTKSQISAVVEAKVVHTPQRRQTLRHVKKRGLLRDSSPAFSLPNSLPSITNAPSNEKTSQSSPQHLPITAHRGRKQSYTSTTTFNTISSGRARREIWKNGGVPVVVVPDRKSSHKPSRTPSLRSTSSQRTRRSLSSASVPTSTSKTDRSRSDERTPVFKKYQRSRAYSESDGSDPRTIDYPPMVPARSSSLSAPTSRNNSRTTSLTAESTWDRQALLNRQASSHTTTAEASSAYPAEIDQYDRLQHKLTQDRLDIDYLGDPFSSRRFSSRNTPFSIGSIDTNGTAPEVSEALAVNIYPHQNSSVIMVDHSNKPSDKLEASRRDMETMEPKIAIAQPSKLSLAAHVHDEPMTPTQPLVTINDIDSPLRNPRSPPLPPMINFTPATPSGSTPFHERQHMLGNYFETMQDEKPQRSMSLVRRALLGHRRHSVSYPPRTTRPGILTRTLSLGRSNRWGWDDSNDYDLSPRDERPAEADKLHPHWRPTYEDDPFWDDPNMDPDDYSNYKYSLIDNRSMKMLADRVRRTFSVFPNRDDDNSYPTLEEDGPKRRTIGRTASGRLRVMKRRSSLDSLVRGQTIVALQTQGMREGPNSQQDQSATGNAQPARKRRFSLSGTIGEIQGLSRRMSEKRREKRTEELRQKISGPYEVRDGVGEVIRRGDFRGYRP